jgi:hypothetical protein
MVKYNIKLFQVNNNIIFCIQTSVLINVSNGVSSCTTQFITISCVVYDGTPLDTFIDMSTTGMCHLKIICVLAFLQMK